MSDLANTIVIIAGVCGALYTIYSFIKRPLIWSKDKKKEINCEIDDRTKKMMDEALEPINEALAELNANVQEIHEMNLEQSGTLDWMNKATLDLLRQEILYLYNHHYQDKKLTMDENNQLHKLYKDYKTGGGNSFVDDLVLAMSSWEVIPNNK